MKRILSIITAFAMTATMAAALVTTTTATAEVKKGHVLGNATVSTADALEILKYIVGLDSAIWTAAGGYNAAAFEAADVFGTGKPTTKDVLEILKAIVHLENIITFIDGIHSSLLGSRTLALFMQLEKGTFTYSFDLGSDFSLLSYRRGEDYYYQWGALRQLGINRRHFMFNDETMKSVEWFPEDVDFWFVPEFGSAKEVLKGVHLLSKGNHVSSLDGKTYYSEEFMSDGYVTRFFFNGNGDIISIADEDGDEYEYFVSPNIPAGAFDHPVGYTMMNCVDTFWDELYVY